MHIAGSAGCISPEYQAFYEIYNTVFDYPGYMTDSALKHVLNCLFHPKSIPVFQSKSIPFKINLQTCFWVYLFFGGTAEKEIYSTGRFSYFYSFIFHCIFIIFFVSFIRYDSPFLWKAFHKNGESLRKGKISTTE